MGGMGGMGMRRERLVGCRLIEGLLSCMTSGFLWFFQLYDHLLCASSSSFSSSSSSSSSSS